MLMNLFSMTVFKTKIKVKWVKLMILPVVSSIRLFLQDVKSWHYCRTSQMLHLCFSVVQFEQCLYLYQMYLVKYHPQTCHN